MPVDIKAQAQHLKKKYCFQYNKKITKHLEELVNFSVARMFAYNTSLFFLEAYSTKTILETDSQYTQKNRFDLSGQISGFITMMVPYKDKFIVGDYHGKQQFIVSREFKRIDTLGAVVPELRDKSIVCAVQDNKGGIYFAERASGILYYLNSFDQITEYQGSFRLPLSMSFIHDTLYICDVFRTIVARQGRNIIAFKDGIFSQTGLTGESIVPCTPLNTFFTSNMTQNHSIEKYDSQLNRVFQRHFTSNDADCLKNFAPTCLCVNTPHLLALDGTTLYIKAFDIATQ